MSAIDHTGEQFVTLYRGLQNISHPDELDPELIGPHWTTNSDTAEYFAGPSGSVVSANVSKKHIVPIHENSYVPSIYEYPPYSVMPGEKHEEETFVKPNVPVHITGMYTHPENNIRDKWTFEKPLVRSSEKLYGYTFDPKKEDVIEEHKGDW